MIGTNEVVMYSPFQMTLKTALGQALDLLSCPPGQKPILKKFTMERYNAIVKYKTSFYSFYLPIALSMYMVSNQTLCLISNAPRRCFKNLFSMSSSIYKCHKMLRPHILGTLKCYIYEKISTF